LRLMIGEPQRPQKQRKFPGDDSHSLMNSAPETNRNEAAGIVAPVEKADPEALRQRLQWQWLTFSSLPSIS
jgi:hypothetical protein